MFCSKCGKEIADEAVICTGCGCAVKDLIINNTVSTRTKKEKKTSAAVTLGIIGIVFAWLFALVGHITSVISIIFGIKEYKENEKMTGLVLGIIGEVCSIFSSIVGAVAFSGLF